MRPSGIIAYGACEVRSIQLRARAFGRLLSPTAVTLTLTACLSYGSHHKWD
jgi:hypothetical protein